MSETVVIDGRDLMNEAFEIILKVYRALPDLKDNFTEESYAVAMEQCKKCVDWFKMYRKRVWLRSKDGVAMASDFLIETKKMETGMHTDNPAQAMQQFYDVALVVAKELSQRTALVT